MFILTTGEDLNKIMRACTPATDAQNVRETMRYIEIQHDGDGNGCATALDGFVMSQTRFSCQGDAGKMLISPYGKVDKDADVELIREGDMTTIRIGDVSRTEKTPQVHEYMDHRRITTEAMSGDKIITVSLNAARLKRILKSHKSHDNLITLHIYAPEAPLVVQSEAVVGIMCPVLHAGDCVKPEFWDRECQKEEDDHDVDAAQSSNHRRDDL